MSAKPRRLEGERPRDRFGRPLAWGSPSELELLDYDSLPLAESHALAIDYFDEGLFFPAHEAWEAAWRRSRGSDDEEFFNGLAKLGAGFTHIQRGNAHGAWTLITKAIDRIAPYGPAHHGIDLASFCSQLGAIAERLEPAAKQRSAPPPISFPKVPRSP